jgi:hypothetical protein
MAVTLTPAIRADIERWFARSGVPQLIDGYRSTTAMDARAAPLIVAWLLIGTIRDWGSRPDIPALPNLLGIAFTLAWIGLVWTAASLARGRRNPFRPPAFDPWDIATLAFAPALPTAIIQGAWLDGAIAAVAALTGIGVIYLIVAFGIPEIGLWAVNRLARHVTAVVGLLARTLPILLILVVFLLFGSEIWQVAHATSPVELIVLLLALLGLAGLLAGTTFVRELADLERRGDANRIRADARSTPASALLAGEPGEIAAPGLATPERLNLVLLVVIPQLVQVVMVTAVVATVLTASLCSRFRGLFRRCGSASRHESSWT